MDWDSLSLEAVRGICNDKSYARGRGYYRGGRVEAVQLGRDKAVATVSGSRRYSVEVMLDGRRGISYYCTCPYNWGGACKHVVATLLHALDHKAEIAQAAKNMQAEIDAMLKGAAPNYMRSFLAGEMERHPSMAERFSRGAGWKRPIGEDYREKVNALFRKPGGAGFFLYEYGGGGGGRAGEVDLDPVISAAVQFERSGNHREAARIYGQIADAVAENSPIGHRRKAYDGIVRDLIGRLGRAAAKIKEEVDGGQIKEIFERHLRGDARFRGDYENALWTACASAANLRELLEAVEPHVPKEGGAGAGAEGGGAGAEEPGAGSAAETKRLAAEGRKMLAYKAVALERLGGAEAAGRALAESAAAGPDTYALYIERLAGDGRLKGAARAAWEGIYRFGDSKVLVDAALAALKGSRRERCAMSEWLYVKSHDPRHLAILKAEAPSWLAARSRLIRELERDRKHPEHLLDLLVGEGMHKRALRAVVALGDMELLGHYRAPLAKRFPKAYTVAYWHGIERMADASRSGAAYRKVALHLQGMALVPAGRAKAKELAGLLRRRHSNRPALVKALGGIKL